MDRTVARLFTKQALENSVEQLGQLRIRQTTMRTGSALPGLPQRPMHLQKLGWGGGMLSPVGTRRKGMHRKTYSRLMQALTDASLATAGEHDTAIERLETQLARIRVPV